MNRKSRFPTYTLARRLREEGLPSPVSTPILQHAKNAPLLGLAMSEGRFAPLPERTTILSAPNKFLLIELYLAGFRFRTLLDLNLFSYMQRYRDVHVNTVETAHYAMLFLSLISGAVGYSFTRSLRDTVLLAVAGGGFGICHLWFQLYLKPINRACRQLERDMDPHVSRLYRRQLRFERLILLRLPLLIMIVVVSVLLLLHLATESLPATLFFGGILFGGLFYFGARNALVVYYRCIRAYVRKGERFFNEIVRIYAEDTN